MMKGFLLALLIFATPLFATEVRSVRMIDTNVIDVPVSSKGTVINLPTKPTKVILGSSGTFGIEFVDDDLVVSPLLSGAQSNLFVYMLGRRFTFDLKATSIGGVSILVVRDGFEKNETKPHVRK